MDKYYVIDITNNIDDLNLDMTNWCNLPHEIRMMSNDECIRRYGMTNIDLYNKLKAILIGNKPVKEPEMIGTMISEDVSFSKYEYTEEEMQYKWKLDISRQLCESPIIAIIDPSIDTMDELDEIYNKYILLSQNNKDFSNSYSLKIWNYNVPNMYTIMSSKIQTKNADKEEPLTMLSNTISSDPLLENAMDKFIEKDLIGLTMLKLDTIDQNSEYNSVFTEINRAKSNDRLELESIVPYYTPDEMDNFVSGPNGKVITAENYSSTLYNTIYRYTHSNSDFERESLREDIKNLGWNPNVELTKENIEFAKQRQNNWLKNYGARIIDVSKMKVTPEVIQESSASMNLMYKRQNLYPIYIVLSFTHTIFGKIITRIKHCTYSHAGLSLDSDLSQIMTFKYDQEKTHNGFHVEGLDKYIANSDESIICVCCIFVDGATRDSIKHTLEDFVKKQPLTTYNFGNLINILIGKEKTAKDNLSLVCSQFVDTVLKLSKINLTNKSSNLVIPQDFYAAKNPKVFKIYEGLAREYDDHRVEAIIRSLYKSHKKSGLMYTEVMESLIGGYTSTSFDYITENEEANSILDELVEMITPSTVIYERKLPFTIKDNGDVSIKLFKSMESEYQEAHKLLTTYNKNNVVGIKHELARLFYVISCAEKKIKKMEKADENYQKMINLRARALNDFKKYLKQIQDIESNFDFAKYYKESEYSDESIEIDKNIFKYGAKLISSVLTKGK